LNHCEVDPPFSCYEFVKDSIDCENNTYCFKIKNTSNPGFDLYSVSIYDLTGSLVLSPTGLINIPNAPLTSGSTSDWICVTYSGVQTGDNVCYKLAAHNNSPGTPPTQCCTDTLENCFVIPDCDNNCSVCPDGSIAGANLIKNGDFSGGYSGGWYSNYNLQSTGLTSSNDYSVRNSTNLVNGQWAALDHTSGNPTGNFLILDGPSSNVAYGVNVMVKPNTDYVFCVWVDNLVSSSTPSDPVIKVDIDGIAVVPGMPLPKTPDGWQLITYNYNSGTTSGSISIEVFDIANTNYNDWAIDDVSFRECVSDTTGDCCENDSLDLLGYIADIFDNRTLDSCQLCFEMDLDSCDYYFINYGNGDSLSGNGHQTMCYSYPGNGNFDITIKIINYDSFGNICVEADSTINIDIYDCTPDSGCDVSLIKIYNALSSGNGDNLNDRLIIEDYLDCGRVDISIYNRWGQLVWKQANYDNTWKGIGLEGKPLPDGTYFLILGLPDQKNKTHRIKTFIDLRRDK